MGAESIQAHGVEKRFGALVALAGVTLELGAGEIVGLVGPNGSGKTTLLRILAGLIRPSAGTVRVFGLDPFHERDRVMVRARFAFAPPALFENLTAREHLEYLARIGARDAGIGRDECERALATVQLAERADDRVRTFSFGMRQRLALAQALLPRPELLVLDEPTEGLDPLAILELRAVLARLASEHGIAILLSSHLLIEIDQLVDRMLVLSEGRPIFAGTPDELRCGSGRTVLDVADIARVLERLRACGLEASANEQGELELPVGALDLARATELLGRELLGFHVRRSTLEEALLARLSAERRR